MKRMVLTGPVSVMIFLGGIYAWSMFVPPLQNGYGLTAAQTQWVFGTVIASFTTAMVGADKLLKRIGFRGMILAAGTLFAAGYVLASHPAGRFETIFIGIGLLSGNLKLIGEGAYADRQLLLAIVLFSLANFSGRLAWGWVSDRFSTFVLLSIALVAQGLSTFLLGHFRFPVALFYLLVMTTGLGFGANFVLFARETAHEFGIHRLGKIYPFIFLGYGLAGIFGPVTGGELFDRFQNFSLSGSISLAASILALGAFRLQLVLVKKRNELNAVETRL